LDLILRDEVMGDIDPAGGHQYGAPNGNAPRNGQTVNGKSHR
jgi:hypothetical protein